MGTHARWELTRPGGERDRQSHPPHCCLFFLSGLAQLFREVRIMKGLNHPNIGEERTELAREQAMGGALGRDKGTVSQRPSHWWHCHSCVTLGK